MTVRKVLVCAVILAGVIRLVFTLVGNRVLFATVSTILLLSPLRYLSIIDSTFLITNFLVFVYCLEVSLLLARNVESFVVSEFLYTIMNILNSFNKNILSTVCFLYSKYTFTFVSVFSYSVHRCYSVLSFCIYFLLYYSLFNLLISSLLRYL